MPRQDDTGPALVRLDQETVKDCCHQRPALTAQIEILFPPPRRELTDSSEPDEGVRDNCQAVWMHAA